MSAQLLAELQALGVVLLIDDGRLAFDTPAGVLSESLLARMRAERDGLLTLVESLDERAAICEFDAGLTRTEAEALAANELVARSFYLPPIVGVICPWCLSGDFLLEQVNALRCDQCDRDAFQFEGASVVRCDWVEVALEPDMPATDSPQEKRFATIKRAASSQAPLIYEP